MAHIWEKLVRPCYSPWGHPRLCSCVSNFQTRLWILILICAMQAHISLGSVELEVTNHKVSPHVSLHSLTGQSKCSWVQQARCYGNTDCMLQVKFMEGNRSPRDFRSAEASPSPYRRKCWKVLSSLSSARDNECRR